MFLLQVFTVAVGAVALSFSLVMFLYFIRSRNRIGRAVAYMLAGESVGIAVTIAFACLSNGIYDLIGPYGALILRWILFSAAIATSAHLAYRTRQIELQLSNDEDGS